jgi:UDP-N-acetylmuramate dehydrogenase
VEFELAPRSPDLIEKQIRQNIQKKRSRQPTRATNAGCVFRNPGDQSAGKMLDRCGLKGSQVGGAVVSRDHANFICNTDGASAREVLELIETMQRAVRNEFGVDLKLELKHWGGDSRVA